MNKALATLPLLLLVACAAPQAAAPRAHGPQNPGPESSAPENPALSSKDSWIMPSAEGPVLIGIVSHPNGEPLADIKVTPHGGFATRFPGASTRTDSLGRYRFDPPLSGSMVEGDDGEMSALYISVCVGSVSGVNPPVYLPWTDIRVLNAAHVVERLDFTFDPESVPIDVRD